MTEFARGGLVSESESADRSPIVPVGDCGYFTRRRMDACGIGRGVLAAMNALPAAES